MPRLACRLLAAIAGLAATGCDNWTGAYGPRSEQNPVIVRFEARSASDPQERGPFELLALASGVGTMAFTWHTSSGWLSVASQSVPVASDSLASSYTAYQPPLTPGTYDVTLTVTDSGGGTFQRLARFQVDERGASVLSPQPTGVPWPPGFMILARPPLLTNR